jgi:rubredoxin-NAD+ reductase
MKKWLCIICGWIYDEAKGWPADGIAPGTRWEDIPADWVCPDCGVAKADFEMLEISDAPAAIATQNVAEKAAPFVIIGSGYAGYNLAAAIRQQSPAQEIVIFTTDDGANYSKPGLSNALARSKSATDLITESLIEIEKRLELRVYARCQVQEIDAKAHKIKTEYGEQQYSKLILALGAAPIPLQIEGDGAQDVMSVNNLSDYHHFREKLESSEEGIVDSSTKHITIIGSGLIGCEFANDLAANGYKVSIVGLSNQAMDKLLPLRVAEQLQLNLEALGVSWHLQNSVKAVKKQQGRYCLTLSNGEVLETDLVLSAIGLAPSVQLAQSAGIHCNRGIVVNGGLRTNVADIYALGDCAEINGQLLPFIAPINHAIKALSACLLGRPTMAQYPLMPIIVKTPALPLTILAPKEPSALGAWQIDSIDAGMRGLYHDQQGQLSAFVLAGDCVNERQQCLDQIL